MIYLAVRTYLLTISKGRQTKLENRGKIIKQLVCVKRNQWQKLNGWKKKARL